AQAEPVILLQPRVDLGAVALEGDRIGLYALEGRQQRFGRDVARYLRGRRPREEARQEVLARRRQLDDRLVHQVQQQVLAADVDDERDPRLDGGDVGEVLVRTHANVGARGRERLLERRDDVLELHLVRDEIVGAEETVGLGEFGDEGPEGSVVELLRQRLDRRARRG